MRRLKGKSGLSDMLVAPLVIIMFAILLTGAVIFLIEMSKITDLSRIAQQIAREISLSGKVDDVVARKLQELETLYGLDVEMQVDGDYLGSTNRLRLESDFTVKVYHHSRYGIGVIEYKGDKMYVGVANGTVEEYHKMP